MVADSLNLPAEQISETIEPKIATERVQTEFLTVEAGPGGKGVHQIARGLSKDGKELVYLELKMYVGAKDPRIRFRSRGIRTSAWSFLAARMATLRRLRCREFHSGDS